MPRYDSKRHIGDLALFGGKPLAARPLHVNRPNVGDLDTFQAHVAEMWQSRWFSNDGAHLQELEMRLSRHLQVRNCVLMCNGTIAMAALLKAMGLTGEVITPSFTFISTAHTLRWANIRPVFCDIDPASMTIDTDHCERLITERTSAVIATHIWGQACDIQRLSAICRAHGIALLFDAAHAFGCTGGGKPLGGFGDAEIFSFHATKAFHTCEGGAVTTNDDKLADTLRKIRNFGFDDHGTVALLGTNAKMSEIHAAMGLTNLDAFADTVARNRLCHETYAEELRGIGGLTFRTPASAEASNFHYAVAELDAEAFGLARDDVLAILNAENILARRYFHPGSHRCEPHVSLDPDAGRALPNTEAASRRIIVFPAGAAMPVDCIGPIADLIRFLADNAGAVQAELGKAPHPRRTALG
ncbi:dTDP-4-amino-4,6-dideoxygalactose transaminase [Breoghania corrubedonensis]|uniref:dTDP-4-amino-4,6-dideoxygalactose transaminase n=1 Tax=Breoghania corrubedonensis TaxID=665038 RepID=A0A2T5UWA4_9HYPH|nr:aminotransferase class I/II-fold pyridoxal phosphate-dependent enzyme [Breoghania corrubedonensis]PTW55741.1 dTDP-4-amino-4,6-dideoxygalactose transaminase [Breoghania corrubedonensis]